jgi:hypothetical protein
MRRSYNPSSDTIYRWQVAFPERAQNKEVSFNNVRFSDEAHFHLDVVNKQSV